MLEKSFLFMLLAWVTKLWRWRSVQVSKVFIVVLTIYNCLQMWFKRTNNNNLLSGWDPVTSVHTGPSASLLVWIVFLPPPRSHEGHPSSVHHPPGVLTEWVGWRMRLFIGLSVLHKWDAASFTSSSPSRFLSVAPSPFPALISRTAFTAVSDCPFISFLLLKEPDRGLWRGRPEFLIRSVLRGCLLFTGCELNWARNFIYCRH